MSQKNTIPKIKHLPESNELNTYYDKIVNNVNHLIQEEQYKKALEIVQEELDQPYTPIKYYDIFQELKFNINSVIYDNRMQDKFWKKSPEELIQLIINSNNFVPEYFHVFIDKIEMNEQQIKDYYALINKIFLSIKLHNNDKFYILKLLFELGVDYEFDFKNSYTNSITKINPVNVNEQFNSNDYSKALNKIQDHFFKDITAYNFATEILFLVHDYYFPDFVFESIDDLTEAIIKYINNVMFSNGDTNWVENKADELVFKAANIYVE